MRIPLLILISLSFICSSACKKDTVKSLMDSTTVKKTHYTYLALGDSYTIGESVDQLDRYPVQLQKKLNNAGFNVDDPKIIATTGWTTANLKNGILNAHIQGNTYDLVSLLIGVNNQYQGKSLSEYKVEFKELLLQAIDFASGIKQHVFVVSIPDYGYTPFGRANKEIITTQIDEFNAINKQITDSIGVHYFNITPISRNGLEDPDLIAVDGLHPSGKMYKQWVDLLGSEVGKMLSQ